MTVKQLLDNIDSRELAEWMAYSRIEADRLSGKMEEPSVSDKIKTAFSPMRDKEYVDTITKKRKK